MTALVAAGYQVYAINPKAVSRYRDRHAVSGAKSDSGDARVLADLVRTDRHNHRRVAGDSDLLEAIRVTARTHQNLVWARQRQVNQLRDALRHYYPGALDAFGVRLADPEAVEALAKAPPAPTSAGDCRPRMGCCCCVDPLSSPMSLPRLTGQHAEQPPQRPGLVG